MSPPAERIWTVNTYYVDKQGQYVHDPDALPNALLELNGLMARVGGVMQMATRRTEIAPGRVETLAVVFRWRSFVPMDRSQDAPELERDGTPEQEAAEPLPAVPDLPAQDAPSPPVEPAPEPAGAASA